MKVVNRQAHFNYELGERIEAGISLSGAETKSAKSGAINMDHAYVKILGGEAFILGLHIYPYTYADNEEYEADRKRKLLLHRKEIVSLESNMKQSRRQLVATAMYVKHGKVKVELALARGKRNFEKRDVIKKRDMDRDEERAR